jgi:hypothetical protein
MHTFPSAPSGREIAVAIRGKGDPRTIGRPRRAEIAAVAGGERCGFSRGYIENPEVRPSAFPSRNEHNPSAVGRKGALIVVCRGVGEAFDARAVGVNAVKIS